MVELLPRCLEMGADFGGAMLLVCYSSMAMPYFESITCFPASFLMATIMVYKVCGAHPLALVIVVLLGGVGGDTK